MNYGCPSWSPLLAAMSRNCNVCNPFVFALRLTHLAVRWQYANYDDFGIRIFFQTTANIWELWFKVSLCWEPLRSTTWKAQVATKDYLKSPTANHKDWSSTGLWILPLIRQRSRHKILCILLFSYISAVFDSFSQLYGGLWKKNPLRVQVDEENIPFVSIDCSYPPETKIPWCHSFEPLGSEWWCYQYGHAWTHLTRNISKNAQPILIFLQQMKALNTS
jgi:hypothetical protein